MSSPALGGDAVAASGVGRAAKAPRSTGERRKGSILFAPLRRFGRGLSALARWVAKQLPAPLRWLGRLFDPDAERGFGFWWRVATIGIAVALGLVVALLLSPVAGLIALLVVAIWALVRWRRHQRPGQHSSNAR
jgi:hypothetical protein